MFLHLWFETVVCILEYLVFEKEGVEEGVCCFFLQRGEG